MKIRVINVRAIEFRAAEICLLKHRSTELAGLTDSRPSVRLPLGRRRRAMILVRQDSFVSPTEVGDRRGLQRRARSQLAGQLANRIVDFLRYPARERHAY